MSLKDCHYSRRWPRRGWQRRGQGGGASGGPDRRAGLPRAEEELGARGRSAEEAAGASALPNEGGEEVTWGGPASRPPLENSLVGPVESFRLFPRDSGKSLKGFKQHKMTFYAKIGTLFL